MKFDVDLENAYLGSSMCWPKKDFDSGEIIERNGLYLYQVSSAVPGERELEVCTVVVPAKSSPVDGIEPMTPLKFDGLTLSIGYMGKKKWWAFRADSVKAL